jgi:carbon storage regulator
VSRVWLTADGRRLFHTEVQVLVLARKVGEKIRVGDDVVFTIVRISGDKVRVGIEAPKEVPVHRDEVYDRIQREEADGAL